MQDALGLLYDFGFTSYDRNLKVLQVTKLDVQLAVTIIIDEDQLYQ